MRFSELHGFGRNELVFASALGLLSSACGSDERTLAGIQPAPETCTTGEVRSCSVTLGEHGDVLTCYSGTQSCVNEHWSVCGYGEVSSRPSQEYWERSMGRELQALGDAEVCSENPCDPECKLFDEIPTSPIGSPSEGMVSGSDFEWETGTLSSFPSSLADKALKEPCSVGNDCQFNTYCYAPVSGTCAHNKCQVGSALSSSCDPCVEEIIDEYPACGVNSSSSGSPSGSGDPCEHSLCEEGGALEDGCSTCAALICDVMPSCCTDSWDDSCVSAVVSECGKTCECGTGEVENAGRCYFQEESNQDWADARDSCRDRGAGWDLASVADAAENDFINDFVIDDSETWIGMTEGMGFSTTDTWVWSSSDPGGTWVEPSGGGGGGGGSISAAYDYGASWKYRAENNAPPGTWNLSGFNDNSWSSGAAELGFGDGDEATSFPKRKRSYYFRKTFNLSSLPVTADLDVIYDDGYVAYLNGTEVARRNVGDIDHGKKATGSDGDNALHTTSIDVGDFVVGQNTMAVMVKNVSQSSDDVSFDSRLVVATGATGVSWGDTWKYQTSDPGNSWEELGYNDSGWSSGAAELGFGDGDEATSISKNDASYYFRKTINLSDAVTSATLSVLYDDGYVAYINGTEVGRRYVGSVAHGAYATGSGGDNDIDVNSVGAGLFVVGANTIAIVVKNRSSGSSDVSFDAELELQLASGGVGGGIYQNFESGEPDGSGACVNFDSDNSGEWEDKSCSTSLDSVCEGPPLVEAGADPPPAEGPWTAIEMGADWRYYDSSSAPGSAWKNLGFNDASWSSGNAHFGFGDGDESTVVNSGRASYYFRKTISILNEVQAASVRVVFDDGVELYVNGTRVVSRNVGSTSHSDYATATSSDNETLSQSIDASAFVLGTNVISALLKNRSSSSSDVSFDAEVEVELCPVGGCPAPSSWTQDCVDEVRTTCGAVCDESDPPSSIGACLPHYPGETDPECPGIDLAVGIPCNGTVPVCNHGQSTAPAGVRLIHFPADFGEFASCTPDEDSGGVQECFTDEEIPPGYCISVTECGGLSEGREIMVNPPGSDEVDECNCRDNWSIYSDAACSPPICSGGSSVATLNRKPVDIIFIIDNSGSMSGEIEQVQDRINEDFTNIIASSGVDYRVIMMSRYGSVYSSVGGSNHPICVASPLGGHNCSNPVSQGVAHNPPIFYHYSTDVQSTDGLCRLIQGLSNSDELASDSRSWTPVAPGGYADLLRPEALKQFVVITDDDVSCSWGGYSFNDGGSASSGESAAAAFDSALLTLRPDQFGTAGDRNYVFHSIVAMTENSPGNAPWPASAPIQTGRCSPGSDGAGTGYQALSRLTGGLRYPTCRNSDFDAIFNALAVQVIEGSELTCSFELANEGQFDPDDSTVVFTPGSGLPLTFAQVDDVSSCGAQSYYYEDEDTITLCPGTCQGVQDDPSGEISVEVGCLPPGEEFETFSYREVYESTCDADKIVQWGFLAYDTVTPGDSSIEFKVRAAREEDDLEDAEWIPLITASTALGTESCPFVGPSPCPVDLYAALEDLALAEAHYIELDAIIQPTSDGRETPVLNNWAMTFSCQFDH